MNQLRPHVVGTVIVVVAALLVLWQHSTSTRLRQETSRLRAENTELGGLREEVERLAQENQDLAKLSVAHDELERLRKEHDELLRLRGEVGVLRSQLAETQRQATNQVRLAPASDPTTIANRDAAVQASARRWYLGDWAQAFRDFALENNGQFPATFAQALQSTIRT